MADTRLRGSSCRSPFALSLRFHALQTHRGAGVSDGDVQKTTRAAATALGAALLLHGAVLVLMLLLPAARPQFALSAAGRPVSGNGVKVTLVAAPTTPPPLPEPVSKPELVRPKPIPHRPKLLTTRTDRPVQQVVTVAPDMPPPEVKPTHQPVVSASQEEAPAPAAINPEMNLPGAQAAKSVQSVACHIPAPVYPMRAKRLGESGTVKLRVALDTTGHVTDVSVESSSGYDDLDGAAVDAVKAGHCAPYVEGGHAVAVFAVQPLTFELN